VKTEITVNVMPMIVQMRRAICCDTNLGIENTDNITDQHAR
jgi:hypothetical protein